MTEHREYGTPITQSELKGHYETNFLSPEQFLELLEAYAKQEFTKGWIARDKFLIEMGWVKEDYQVYGDGYSSDDILKYRKIMDDEYS